MPGSPAAAEREAHAERLKERVYLTFTALAVVLALRSHGGTAEEAAGTLAIAVLGTLLAVFVADVVSHIAVHAVLPDRRGLRHMLQVSSGALGAVVLPFVFMALAVTDVMRLEAALRASTIALVAGLVAIGFLAARRVRLPAWQRLVVLLAEFVLGVLVVGLELLAHG
jgi:ABC-type phosphate/phosphonate transport system permease subunit